MEADLRLAFACAAVAFGLLYAWPLARRWLPEAGRLTVGLTAFGLGLGALSMWMFALALLPGALSLASVLALPVVVFAVGVISHQPSVVSRQSSAATPHPKLRTADYGLRFTFYLTLVPIAVITVNVLYYPFYYADTLSRYGLFARRIFEAGGLTEAVQGYPLLVSMGYALAFFAAGGVNDRLAGLVSAAFATGTVGITYALACRMYGRRAALAAAFLAATSTLFVVWGTSGYVDIPTGFFFGLSALFAYRWLESGAAGDAWLAGVAAGLAIWTKQAGLAILPSLALVLALAVWQVRARHRMLLGLRGQRSALALGRPLALWDYVKGSVAAGAIILLAALVIAGPWYLRNYLLSGPAAVVPLPGEFYAAQADHRLVALLPFLTRPAEWGWAFAVLGLGGLLWGLMPRKHLEA